MDEPVEPHVPYARNPLRRKLWEAIYRGDETAAQALADSLEEAGEVTYFSDEPARRAYLVMLARANK
jgi:hypothetical protein